MIKIKKLTKIEIKLINGEPVKISSKDKKYHDHKIMEYGYEIYCNKLGEEFKDNKGELRFKKKLFIPFINIKMVEEKYEYQIEENEVLKIIQNNCDSNGIKDSKIKKIIEKNGVEISNEELEENLHLLKKDGKIYWESDLKPWIIKTNNDEDSKSISDPITPYPQPGGIEGCKNERKLPRK